jgi:hypothetical protein
MAIASSQGQWGRVDRRRVAGKYDVGDRFMCATTVAQWPPVGLTPLPGRVAVMALFKSKKKKAEELFATGSKGAGTVVQVQDTGTTINDNPRVKMTFRVEPIDGSPAFDAEKTTTVSRVQIPRQGDRYPVWYDPQDPGTWAYATVADDQGRATMRELFGEIAESFVGMNAPGAPAPQAAAPQAQDTVEQLKQLADLHSQGLLTDDEFTQQKGKLLG